MCFSHCPWQLYWGICWMELHYILHIFFKYTVLISDSNMHSSADATAIANFLQCLSQLYLGIYLIESHQSLYKMFKINIHWWFSFHVQNFQQVVLQHWIFHDVHHSYNKNYQWFKIIIWKCNKKLFHARCLYIYKK